MIKPYFETENGRLLNCDVLEGLASLPDESVHCCVTSPPYWGLRDYGHDGQLGLEATPEEYVQKMVTVFREVRRVLRKDGTLWINLGDSYNGSGGAGGDSTTYFSGSGLGTAGTIFNLAGAGAGYNIAAADGGGGYGSDSYLSSGGAGGGGGGGGTSSGSGKLGGGGGGCSGSSSSGAGGNGFIAIQRIK